MTKRSFWGLMIVIILCLFLFGAVYAKVALVGPKESEKELLLPSSCAGFDTYEQKSQCWYKLIDKSLQGNNLNDTFTLVDSLYKTEPDFSSGCHIFLHNVGQKVYKLFLKDNNLNLPKITTYCGYGFYHGFMQELVKKSKNTDLAGTFCARVTKNFNGEYEAACFHGIGHGTIDVTDKSTYGNAQAIVDNALSLCKKTTQTKRDFSKCSTGAFMELSNYLINDDHGLLIKKSDPLALCRSQNEEVMSDCYAQLNSVLMWASDWNFLHGARFIEKIPENAYAVEAIETYSSANTHVNKDNVKTLIEACRSLQSRLYKPCVEGVVQRFISEGSAGNEYKLAEEICNNFGLTRQEKGVCFGRILKQSRGLYSALKLQQVCKTIPSVFRTDACAE